MIMGVVVSQVSDDAVNQKIEEAFDTDDSFKKKMEEEKAAIEKLQNEIIEIKENPSEKLTLRKKMSLRRKLRHWKRGKIAFWLKTRSRAKWWPTSKKRKRR